MSAPVIAPRKHLATQAARRRRRRRVSTEKRREDMVVSCWYKCPGLSRAQCDRAKAQLQNVLPGHVTLDNLQSEACFYIESSEALLNTDSLEWMLRSAFTNDVARTSSLPTHCTPQQRLVEIGPRLNFSTAFSTNAVSMLQSMGLSEITRVEKSIRYLITLQGAGDTPDISKELEAKLVSCLHDKMTQCRYTSPLTSFALDVTPEAVYDVDIMSRGKAALEEANQHLGLALDAWDVDYYTTLFRDKVQRNPTSVECFDLAQSNSEHSRHWFFKGRMVVEGEEETLSLMQMVASTQDGTNPNNTIKFSDNSSAIEGFDVKTFRPEKPAQASAFVKQNAEKRNLIFTAETHNFPTGVAPFPGATTGTGGRIRDVQATGRGAHVIAGTAGYCFGNLNIPGYKLPWEDSGFEYPDNLALPRHVAIEASNGASDYGNKFGEPVIAGFARSCGLRLASGERREWVKPIMFSGGIGSMNDTHTHKLKPEVDMEVVKVGGPVYRIGVGGGAASSIEVQGDNASSLDLGAVQRGDAEMEQKMNRVIRACVELGENNPICSIHDQGAGGNGNVLKEISEPTGAVIHTSAFSLGDPTLSALEIWGAEYQESNAMLVRPADRVTLMKMAAREKCDVNFVGKITGDGKIRLVDDRAHTECDDVSEPPAKQSRTEQRDPVDLDLELVLGSMPRKVFNLSRTAREASGLSLPDGLTVHDALKRVLRLPAVASKRYLTNKVDRAVTGLIAQQQCVGPLHTPLADVAVTALSYYDTVGGATAIGEQPMKGLVDAAAGARMTVGEALTNLVFAQITDIKDVKCSGNWMWAAKLAGEGALLVDACRAMCDVMTALGVGVDGGKDSLSMAARVGDETVKAPGALVVSAYVGCPDITATLTPDLKAPQETGALLWVRFGPVHSRLGGSALAQCFGQIGDVSPDLDDANMFTRAFNTTQLLIKDRKLLSGHDVSDGGLVTCLLEMAFAGNCGLDIDIPTEEQCIDPVEMVFAEELGIVVEVESRHKVAVMDEYSKCDVVCLDIGSSTNENKMVKVSICGSEVLHQPMTELRDLWEETSYELEKLQTNSVCVEQERAGLKSRKAPPLHITDKCQERLQKLSTLPKSIDSPPRVCVLREEGSNGDREMAAAFDMSGFQVWDVNMQDLTTEAVSLDQFVGLVFVGGFSYADVLGSAKGWAGAFLYNSSLRAQLSAFYARDMTFSLGVCNGCQLMATLGIVATDVQTPPADASSVHLGHNESGRFESRFATVRIEPSAAIMLRGLEQCTLGIWLQHGEGQFKFRDAAVLEHATRSGLAPIRYVDDDNQPTTAYPHNPNGSPAGIAALCTQDGRHLAMMPHPERCVLPWQWPWMPAHWTGKIPRSPWLCMFANAYAWCTGQDIE